MQVFRKKVSVIFYLLVTSLAIACGGEQLAGGGIGGTGITSGTITGFGSVFVNGVEFDTAGATRIVDDVVTISNGADDMTVMDQGMVVTVSGTVNADGITGTATAVEFDEIVEGPIAAAPVEDPDMITKTFDVLGITVVVDRNNTVFVGPPGFDYASIAADDIVEISGFFDATGNLRATHVNKERDLLPGSTATVEVHGTVSGFNGVDTFMLGTIKVTFSGATVFEGLPGTVTDGQFVEASGPLSGPTAVNAMRIELEDSSFTQAASISLEGVVTQFNGTGNFLVRDQPVDASMATFMPPSLATTIGDDDRVEIRGSLSGVVLKATTVEDRGGSLKVGGQVIAVNAVDAFNGTVAVEVIPGGPLVTVNVDSRTQLEDDLGIAQPFTLTDLMWMDEVIVEGTGNGGNVVDAGKLKRKVLDKYELKAYVQAANGDDTAGSVTLLGLTFTTNSMTEFEDSNDQQFPNGGDDFYSVVTPGDLLEIEDDKPVDGIADEVELKN